MDPPATTTIFMVLNLLGATDFSLYPYIITNPVAFVNFHHENQSVTVCSTLLVVLRWSWNSET